MAARQKRRLESKGFRACRCIVEALQDEKMAYLQTPREGYCGLIVGDEGCFRLADATIDCGFIDPRAREELGELGLYRQFAVDGMAGPLCSPLTNARWFRDVASLTATEEMDDCTEVSVALFVTQRFQ